jgi:hypothetical protein
MMGDQDGPVWITNNMGTVLAEDGGVGAAFNLGDVVHASQSFFLMNYYGNSSFLENAVDIKKDGAIALSYFSQKHYELIEGASVPLRMSGGRVNNGSGMVTSVSGVVAEGVEEGYISGVLIFAGEAALDVSGVVPAGSFLQSVSCTLQVALVGAGGAVKVGLGTVADPDLYGLSTVLTQHAKINTAVWAALVGATQICATACDAAGAALGTFASGELRYHISFRKMNGMEDY